MSGPFGPVIAHRGCSSRAPENTAAAFEMAIAAGCDMIELDARLTADGGVVVVHDDELGRYGHPGRVSGLRLDELRGLDAGRWFGPAFAGERFLTLAEALNLIARRVPVNVEIKLEREEDRELAARLVDGALAEIDAALRRPAGGAGDADANAGAEPDPFDGHILFSSFSTAIIELLRARAPRAPWAALVGRHGVLAAAAAMAAAAPGEPITPLIDGVIPDVVARGGEGLHVHRDLARPEVIEAAHRAGLSLRVYTVNDPARMAQLIEQGVDGIFTDVTGELLTVLGRQRSSG